MFTSRLCFILNLEETQEVQRP